MTFFDQSECITSAHYSYILLKFGYDIGSRSFVFISVFCINYK